jgi:hypothetical protein
MIQLAVLAVGLAAAHDEAPVSSASLPVVAARAVRQDDDDDARTERRVARQRRGGDAFREDVVTLRDGSVLRGTITSQQDDAWFIRIAGGSVLRIDPAEIDTHFRESRYAHPTAHGRQVLARLGVGFEGDIAYAENFATHSGLSSELGLGWAPHNNVELDLAVLLGPSGTKFGAGVRYFVNAQSALKAYGSTTFLLAGPHSPKGLRLGTGFQLDTSRWVGFFFHHGATAFGQGDPTTIHLGYHLEAGVQVRY